LSGGDPSGSRGAAATLNSSVSVALFAGALAAWPDKHDRWHEKGAKYGGDREVFRAGGTHKMAVTSYPAVGAASRTARLTTLRIEVQAMQQVTLSVLALIALLTVRTAEAQPPAAVNAGPVAQTLPKDDGERRILEVLRSAQQGERHFNVSTEDGRLLRQLTEAVNAKRVVELGTSTGESGLWFALALRKTGGKLYTHDIDAGRIAIARENFKKAGVDDLITIIEGDAHKTAPKDTEPIDILFIDAEKEGYDAYLRELLPLVRPGGLILAHNMRRPAPNPRYIEAITTNPELDTSFVLMDGAGIGITLKKR
jgi:caffeoyl-CoA O-methyltransferase